jgi:gas vesicle protein
MSSSNNDNSSNFGKVLTALFTGAALGAAAGILFAPDKGKNTREKISKKANKLGKDVKSKAEDVKARVESEYENLKAQVEKTGDKFDERKHDLANSVKQTTESIKNGR